MEIEILKEEKDFLELKIVGETHTLCNIIRNELWEVEDTSFASYNLKHPLISSPILAVKVKKGKPRKVLLDAVQSLKTKTKQFKSLLTKLS
ncbi:DNA-directed RNA polymerase subunit L [Candidatus Woesearchaeota archaeon]|nr:DNA-directed RNA polymerase subunit L [Candidatus Woesearchaeota archaeon]